MRIKYSSAGRGRSSSRLVSYPPEVQRALRGEDGDHIGQAEVPPSSNDDYATRLVKYVPAETVAFAAVFTTFDLPDWGLWILFVIALVATPIFYAQLGWQPLFGRALTVAAAAVWIIGTTSFGTDVLGLSYAAAKVILATGTFLTPAADLLVQRWVRNHKLH